MASDVDCDRAQDICAAEPDLIHIFGRLIDRAYTRVDLLLVWDIVHKRSM